MRYDVCGLSFESAEPFPELTPSPQSESIPPGLRFRQVVTLDAGPKLRPAAGWVLPDGRRFLDSFRTEKGYLLDFLDLVEVYIDTAGTEVLYAPRPGVPGHSIRHILLDSVLALVMNLRGHAVLHASAVLTRFGACAFAAASGVGKSTLAASFQRAGLPTLTDDCLLLEAEAGSIFAVPSYPNVRLRRDSLALIERGADAAQPVAHYTSKMRLKADGFAVGRHRLAALYCLERKVAQGIEDHPIDAPVIEPVTGADRFMFALRFMFCLDPHDPPALLRQFRQIDQLLSSVPVLRLSIPDAFAALPRVHELVLADLESRSEVALPAAS